MKIKDSVKIFNLLDWKRILWRLWFYQDWSEILNRSCNDIQIPIDHEHHKRLQVRQLKFKRETDVLEIRWNQLDLFNPIIQWKASQILTNIFRQFECKWRRDAYQRRRHRCFTFTSFSFPSTQKEEGEDPPHPTPIPPSKEEEDKKTKTKKHFLIRSLR